MNTIGEVFSQSSDAVFSIDASGRIRFSNSQFESLMGYSGDTLRGKWCAEVLCGTDIHGQPFCGTDCPIPKQAPEATANRDFDLVVRRAGGDCILVNIGATYIPLQLREHAGQADVFFSMRQVTPQRLLRRMASVPDAAPATTGSRGRGRLTSREKEVLSLAARGMTTTRIARHLFVSTQTVRSHFRNIYPKLGVNSRTEAVIYAMQHGMH